MLIDYNKGTKYLNAQKYEKAIQCFKRELQQHQFKECYLNLGNCYRQLNKLDLANKSYLHAADTSMPFADNKFGEYAMALNNLGLMQYTLGNDDEAIKYYKHSLSIDPDLVDALWNYASAALRKLCSHQDIDPDLAWNLYFYRFKRINPTHIDRSLPFWDCTTYHKKIIVLTEQGYGDKLQFARYLDSVKQYCDELIIQCPPDMAALHTHTTYTGTDILSTGADCSVPLCNLAHIFGITKENYDWFKHKVKPRSLTGNKPNIIIEWQGSTTHTNDQNRSCNVGYFNQLQKYGNLLNIRPGAVAPNWIQCFNSKSWMESAELVLGCDLVITVDTSLVHLAGCLGVPTILLQPKLETDFRWGNHTMGLDNVWYPTVKVIRNPNSWEHVFKQVHELLKNAQAL